MSKSTSIKRVLIMAGGTGGHVFPGLALGKFLREKGIDVHFLGTSAGLEAHLVPEADFTLHLVTIHGLRGKGIKPLLLAPFKIMKAILQAKRIIQSIAPDVVIGMGGFVSGPGGVASWILGCPLVIHEQNAKAGFTNKILARIAKKVLEGFPNTFPSRTKVITIGNPVRHDIESLPPPHERFAGNHSPFRLLVLGGSLGAKALNEIVPSALLKLDSNDRPEVYHQTGEKHIVETKQAYMAKGIEPNVVQFITNMAQSYAWADFVLCRAGALTISELCAVGLGAVLVPYPYAVDDHQSANADYMVANNAAICVLQKDLTDDRLADIIREFARSKEKRIEMSEAAYKLRNTHVTERFFDILTEIVRTKSN